MKRAAPVGTAPLQSNGKSSVEFDPTGQRRHRPGRCLWIVLMHFDMTAPDMAVPAPIEEIDEQAKHGPTRKQRERVSRQAEEQIDAAGNGQRRHKVHRRGPEGTVTGWIGPAQDHDGDLVYLTRLQWDIDRVTRDHPDLKLTATKEMMV